MLLIMYEQQVKRMDLSLIIHIDEVTNVWPLLYIISLFIILL